MKVQYLKTLMVKLKIKSHRLLKDTLSFLSTATPSPNDFIELGTSSEALGYMGYMDMLGKFLKTIKIQLTAIIETLVKNST